MTYDMLCRELCNIGADDASAEAIILINSIFGLSPARIIAERERNYTGAELECAIEKRRAKIPLQYIVGKWQFMGLDFFVSPDCLIPRPDTEILVERAIKEIKTGAVAADLCTGSGCIGISMLKYRSDIKSMLFADISQSALNIAEKNVHAHGVEDKSTFALLDVTEKTLCTGFDMIVSNPPYIPAKDIAGLSEEVKKEPHIALDGGTDGLDVIRSLIFNYTGILNKGGKMLIEFGYDQGEKMRTLLNETVLRKKAADFEIVKDYQKNDRLAVIYAC